MEAVIVALICATVYGAVVILAEFVRRLVLSRDKKLNEEALSRALTNQIGEMEKLRQQMQSQSSFEAHYHVLKENREVIQGIGLRISSLLSEKASWIQRYSQDVIKELESIRSEGKDMGDRKLIFDQLRDKIDSLIASYDAELKNLQEERGQLWKDQTDFQKSLLTEEKSRNASMNEMFKQHAAMLEKFFITYTATVETIALKDIDAGGISFKDILMAPIQFLMQFFSGSAASNVEVDQPAAEKAARAEVNRVEELVNEPDEVMYTHKVDLSEVKEAEEAHSPAVSV